jgi:hypothetical protein
MVKRTPSCFKGLEENAVSTFTLDAIYSE